MSAISIFSTSEHSSLLRSGKETDLKESASGNEKTQAVVANIQNIVISINANSNTSRIKTTDPMQINDILVKIFQHLETKEIVKCSTICRKWNAIIKSNKYPIWRYTLENEFSLNSQELCKREFLRIQQEKKNEVEKRQKAQAAALERRRQFERDAAFEAIKQQDSIEKAIPAKLFGTITVASLIWMIYATGTCWIQNDFNSERNYYQDQFNAGNFTAFDINSDCFSAKNQSSLINMCTELAQKALETIQSQFDQERSRLHSGFFVIWLMSLFQSTFSCIYPDLRPDSLTAEGIRHNALLNKMHGTGSFFITSILTYLVATPKGNRLSPFVGPIVLLGTNSLAKFAIPPKKIYNACTTVANKVTSLISSIGRFFG